MYPMSISFTPSGPSVRSDAALAAVNDTSVFTIAPRPSVATRDEDAPALNAGLLRSVPWSEGGQAGRLMRGGFAERFGIPCYDGTAFLSAGAAKSAEPARRGLASAASGARAAAPADAVRTMATLDVTTGAHLVRSAGDGHVLFLSFDAFFDPAYRAVDFDDDDQMRAVANYQDLAGIAVAASSGPEEGVRLLAEAATPRGTGGTLRYAETLCLDDAGRIAVEPAADSSLAPCAGNGLRFASRLASSAESDDFDITLFTERGDAGVPEGARGGGVCWLAGMERCGGVRAPLPYDVARPATLAQAARRRARLAALPGEAVSGFDLNCCAAFAIDPARLGKEARIDVLAAQRMASVVAGPGEEIRVAASLFIASWRVVLRNGASDAPELRVTRRRCWGSNLRHETDLLGSATLPRPVAGTAWHG